MITRTVLVMTIALAFLGLVVSQMMAYFYLKCVYIPIVMQAPSATHTPTPTPTPTATPTPTLTPTTIPYSPIPVGAGIHFRGWENNIPYSGVVVKAEFKQTLIYWGDTYTPQGVFLIVIMDVTNNGLVSDSVSSLAFKVTDTIGRQFDMAEIMVQLAAKYQYNLKGVYYDIQPGFTVRSVFVFDVIPSQYFTLVSLSSW